MKVLLYGEYSGVHGNLMNGLVSLGCDVDLITSGDGFKRFRGTVSLRPRTGGFVQKFITDLSNVPRLINAVGNYDIVQFINPRPGVVTHHGLVEPSLITWILRKAKRAFYYVCGCDSQTFEVFRSNPTYFKELCAGCLKDYSLSGCVHTSGLARGIDYWFLDRVDGIIASTRGAYSDIYRKHEKFLGEIPFAIAIDGDLISQRSAGKRSFFHGINRYYTKGSDRISTYLEKLQVIAGVKYEISRGLPINLYREKLLEHRFLIDQLYGDSIGMNSLLSASLGRIVLTRYDDSLNKNIPFFNVGESFESFKTVVSEVQQLSEAEINKIVDCGFEYIIKNHNPETIAQQFLCRWSR